MSIDSMSGCRARSGYTPPKRSVDHPVRRDVVLRRQQGQQWIWLAIDEQSAEIVGLSVGARHWDGADGLWQSLPAVYRQCAVASTDFWSSYEEIFPANRHCAVGKETSGTSKIERCNNTVRQSISRLVRKTLSFSTNPSNHIGAIWLFVHHYNASLGQ
jgi:insertion element IS1 protein InsB